MTTIIDFQVQNDADFNQGFIYRVVEGDPIDISGCMMRMGIRRHAIDVEEEMLLTTETGELSLIDPVNGNFRLLLTRDQLLELPIGDYVHSLVITFPSGEHRLLWNGTLTNNAGPSRVETLSDSMMTMAVRSGVSIRKPAPKLKKVVAR